jgi:hypothetical protein
MGPTAVYGCAKAERHLTHINQQELYQLMQKQRFEVNL